MTVKTSKKMADKNRNSRRKRPINKQTCEIIASLKSFMKTEAELYKITGQPLIPIENYKQRVLAALKISKSTYTKVTKEAAQVASGELSAFLTPRSRNEDVERLEEVDQGFKMPPLIIVDTALITQVKPKERPLFACSTKIKPIHQCKKCKFLTFYKTDLLDHIQSFHFEKKIFRSLTMTRHKCTNCIFRTYSVIVLFKHCQICLCKKTKIIK